ncbi:MAG: hypothetical protein NC395_10260 [Prevotella sp.]|nr:hypothetical protein [Prevotella sp.]
MAKYSLSFYTFRIIDTKNHQQAITLGKINGEDLEVLLYDYFIKTASKYINNSKDEQLFRTVNFDANIYNYKDTFYYKSITAFIKTGEYGNEEEIVDYEKQKVTKTLSPNEAPVKPFGFAIYFHPDKDTAILVTQSLGGKGISAQIKKLLKSFVTEISSTYSAEIKNVIPNELLQQLLDNSEIKKICIETYKETDFALEDELGEKTTLRTSKNTTVYSKPLISNKKFFFDVFTKRRNLSKIAGLSNDETITNISINFGNKSINYNAYFNTKITEDITKEFKDEPFGALKLYNIMDLNVLEYLYLSNIIQRINDYSPSREIKRNFWVDEEKDVLHEHKDDTVICN